MNLAPSSSPLRWVGIAILLISLVWLATVGVISREPSLYGIDVAAGQAKFRGPAGSDLNGTTGLRARLYGERRSRM